MIAAGEPRNKSSRSIASKSFAIASTDERSTSQSGRVSDRGVGDGWRDVPGRLSPGGARSLAALTAVAQHSSRLIFEMFYITDELLFYALKHEGHVGEFALRLANLVYSVVFRHEVRERVCAREGADAEELCVVRSQSTVAAVDTRSIGAVLYARSIGAVFVHMLNGCCVFCVVFHVWSRWGDRVSFCSFVWLENVQLPSVRYAWPAATINKQPVRVGAESSFSFRKEA